jgi:ElaB/YqjD/DUF883 family membrane-anchored ribosome-binding protein
VSEGEKFGGRVADEAERLGKRVASKVGGAVDVAGQQLDRAVDYVDSATQNMRDSLGRIRDEGWRGVCDRTLEYTRKEPMNALLVAVGAGLLLGWLTKRSR